MKSIRIPVRGALKLIGDGPPLQAAPETRVGIEPTFPEFKAVA